MIDHAHARNILYSFRPFFLYLIVRTAAGAAMEAVQAGGLVQWAAEGTGPALSYALQRVWDLLYTVIPAGTGCIFIREDVRQAVRRKQEGTVPLPLQRKVLPVLLVSAVCLSLGINLLCALFPGGAAPADIREGSLPGVFGFLLQAMVYGVYMPVIEEILFRGILYFRLCGYVRKREAVLLSAAAFGLYHGASLQGLYAFAMGILFAAAYGCTGRLAVPLGLHGACNLCILLLRWTDSFRRICTPPWTLAFSVLAACGFFTIYRIEKKDFEKNKP